MSEKKSDLEIIGNGFENVMVRLNECFETSVDDKKSKMNVVGSVFKLGKSIAGLSWHLGRSAIKHTPRALATVAAAKREVITVIEEEVHEHKKRIQQEALDAKIRALKIKPRIKS